MVKFEFQGKEYEADERAAHDYRIIKAVATAKTNPAALFDAFERMFMGKDELYAEQVGGTIEAMTELFGAALEAADAKN